MSESARRQPILDQNSLLHVSGQSVASLGGDESGKSFSSGFWGRTALYQYADRECADCHIVLPANVMVERTGTAVTGQSRSVSHPGNNSFDTARQTHTTTTHTRNIVYYLCGACDERRRNAVRRVIMLTFFIGSLVLVAVPFGMFTSPALNDSVNTSTEVRLESTADDYLTLRDDSTQQFETLAGEDNPSSGAFDNSSEAVSERVAEAASQLWPDITAAVAAQVERALVTGSSQEWSWRGMRGDIVVSPASETTSGPCRALYLRLFTTQDAQQSPNQVHCYSESAGRWILK